MKKRLLIVGGGFAGFWSAISAIRQGKELGMAESLSVTLINTDDYLTIRPRLYETSLNGLRIKLKQHLNPLGVDVLIGKVEIIEPEINTALVSTAAGARSLSYDYLILASGSQLKGINLPGVEKTFNIDTYDHAKKLETHISKLVKRGFSKPGDDTFLVVGGGFTGLEIVTLIQEKVQSIQEKFSLPLRRIQVILVEKEKAIAQGYSGEAKAYIYEILTRKEVQIIEGQRVIALKDEQVILNNHQQITTQTVIWTGGMVASFLTRFFKGERDGLERLRVDSYLKSSHYPNAIFAGDVANIPIDVKGNTSLMACQFSMDTGKLAGHNAVNDLFGQDLIPYRYPNYVTCLDLGVEDALLTTGWQRVIKSKGPEAKKVKKNINERVIYPSKNPSENLIASHPKFLQL